MSSIFSDTYLSTVGDGHAHLKDRFLEGPGPTTIAAFVANPSETVGMISVPANCGKFLQVATPFEYNGDFDIFVFVGTTSSDLMNFYKANKEYLSWFIAPEDVIGTCSVKCCIGADQSPSYFDTLDCVTLDIIQTLPLVYGGGVFWPEEEEAFIEALKARVAAGTKTAVFTTYDSLCEFTGLAIDRVGARVLAIFDKGRIAATASRPRDHIFAFSPPFYKKALFFSSAFDDLGVENEVDCSGSGELGPGARFTMGRLLARA